MKTKKGTKNLVSNAPTSCCKADAQFILHEWLAVHSICQNMIIESRSTRESSTGQWVICIPKPAWCKCVSLQKGNLRSAHNILGHWKPSLALEIQSSCTIACVLVIFSLKIDIISTLW